MEFDENTGFSAFLLAARELEIMGFCPNAPENRLSDYWDTCFCAASGGVSACHGCIKEYFETDYAKRTVA